MGWRLIHPQRKKGKTPMPMLVVVEQYETKKIPFHKSPFVVGRGVECDLVIVHNKVSRQHISIVCEDNTYFITDLESTNGTWLNGKPLKDRQPLTQGDTIRIGTVIMNFVQDAGSLAAQTLKMDIPVELVIDPSSAPPNPTDITRPIPVQNIFISHSSKEDAFVSDLAQKLQKFRIETWVDHISIETGQDWETEIKDALSNADSMILVLSPDALKSRPVKAEWQFFLNLDKPLYAIKFPDVEVPFMLSTLQFVEFEDDINAVILNLLRNVLA